MESSIFPQLRNTSAVVLVLFVLRIVMSSGMISRAPIAIKAKIAFCI